MKSMNTMERAVVRGVAYGVSQRLVQREEARKGRVTTPLGFRVLQSHIVLHHLFMAVNAYYCAHRKERPSKILLDDLCVAFEQSRKTQISHWHILEVIAIHVLESAAASDSAVRNVLNEARLAVSLEGRKEVQW